MEHDFLKALLREENLDKINVELGPICSSQCHNVAVLESRGNIRLGVLALLPLRSSGVSQGVLPCGSLSLRVARSRTKHRI